jgi:hypothetical protein
MLTAGIVLLVVGGLGWLGYVVNRARSGRLASTPFVRTGEAATRGAQVASPKGAVSVDGRVACPAPLLSPVTQTPCLYYELNVAVSWKAGDSSRTEPLEKVKQAAQLTVDDGSGPIRVDLSKGAECDAEKKFKDSKSFGFMNALKGGPIAFGDKGYAVHPREVVNGALVPSDAKYEVSERVIPLADRMFVAGKIGGDNAIGSPSWTALILSQKTREQLMGDAAKFAKRSLIAGSVGTVAGGVLALVGQLTGG